MLESIYRGEIFICASKMRIDGNLFEERAFGVHEKSHTAIRHAEIVVETPIAWRKFNGSQMLGKRIVIFATSR